MPLTLSISTGAIKEIGDNLQQFHNFTVLETRSGRLKDLLKEKTTNDGNWKVSLLIVRCVVL